MPCFSYHSHAVLLLWVTGLLYVLVDYIDTCEAIKINPQSVHLCIVRRKSNKQPKKVQESVYPNAKKRKNHDTIYTYYDPRALDTCCTDEEKQAGQLIVSLQSRKQVDCMWLSSLEYNYKDYCLDKNILLFLKNKQNSLYKT